MIHPTPWVLLAEILSSAAKRRAPTLLSPQSVLSRPTGLRSQRVPAQDAVSTGQ